MVYPRNITRIIFFSSLLLNHFHMPGTVINSQYINITNKTDKALILISVNIQVGESNWILKVLKREIIFQKNLIEWHVFILVELIRKISNKTTLYLINIPTFLLLLLSFSSDIIFFSYLLSKNELNILFRWKSTFPW